MKNARCMFSDCFLTARALFATPRNGGPKPYSKDPIKVSADAPGRVDHKFAALFGAYPVHNVCYYFYSKELSRGLSAKICCHRSLIEVVMLVAA